MPLNIPYLPYGRQNIDDADIDAVVSVLKSDWLTTGPAVDELESTFAHMIGAPHAVCCANGTAALHLGYLALGLRQGDRVVVPAITFLATANAVRLVGAEVIFADVDRNTALMTPETLRDALGRAEGPVAAIAPVHMGGQSVDMVAVRAIADRAGARIVEDACHALGGTDQQGRPVGGGAEADLTIFSLHPVKAIAAGEGGLVTTADAGLADAVRRYRNHGMVRDNLTDSRQALTSDGTVNPWYYEMLEPGFNYRLSDIHAALATSQLKKLNRFVEQRRALVAHYDAAFAALPSHIAALMRPSGRVAYGSAAWHLYVALIDFEASGQDRARVMHALHERGIGTQVHYLPLNRQPYYRQRYGALDLPGADSWYAHALSLPLHPGMEVGDVDRVMAALTEIVGRSR